MSDRDTPSANMSAALVSSIRNATETLDEPAVRKAVTDRLNAQFPDLTALRARPNAQAGPSTTSRPGTPASAHDRSRLDHKGKQKQRSLEDEIAYWETEATAADAELAETARTLPRLLSNAHDKLQRLLSEAQNLSLQRYMVADKLAGVINEISGEHPAEEAEEAGKDGQEKSETLLRQMELLESELSRLEAGLTWVTVMEKVVLLSERVLDPSAHRPSPVAAVPAYRELHALVASLLDTLPASMSLRHVVVDVRDRSWSGLKDIMMTNLLQASEALKWPLKVNYSSAPPQERRAFERAFQDLLYLQNEYVLHDMLFPQTAMYQRQSWWNGHGLYPLQALVQPISLRFKYHFQGSKNTNRVDKPEWAFSNILDQVYEQTAFVEGYLQPLANRAGFGDVDMRCEFILLLCPILHGMLRARIPKLLDHPALLAHTIYQTIVFDDAVRAGDFSLQRTSLYAGTEEKAGAWEGLAGVILREENWFQQWLAGEKKFVDGQLHEIISASDAWQISDEAPSAEDEPSAEGLRPTISARQIKSLIEQVTDRYAPLPQLSQKLPFLSTIQLPTLNTYLSRLSGSMDAFETLSSAFVRAVPGALSGNARGGLHIDQSRTTGGVAGLEKLIKARLSAGWIELGLRGWADDIFFIEMSNDLADAADLRRKIREDGLLPLSIRMGHGTEASVLDTMIEKYTAACARAEDMIVRHVTVEVENDLKQHLQRRWDQKPGDAPAADTSLVTSIAAYTGLVKCLAAYLPPLLVTRLYRRIVAHISNHIQQRAVFSGWSRFTPTGGQSFAAEIEDWVQASQEAMRSLATSEATAAAALSAMAVEVPWAHLRDAAKILSLPNGDETSDAAVSPSATFAQAMAAAWSDGTESLKLFLERVGIEDMSREDLQGILRRRTECWR